VGVAFNIIDGRRYARKLKQLPEGGSLPPEERLPTAIFGAPCISIGLIVFAFTSQKDIHWIFSILAGIPFGMGQFLVYLASSNYLVDAYTIYAGKQLSGFPHRPGP
jgi:glucose uptake protein GlcU